MLVGFGFSFALYGLSFLITRGQGLWSDNGLLLWFSTIVAPLLITLLVGAVVGAKLMRRKAV